MGIRLTIPNHIGKKLLGQVLFPESVGTKDFPDKIRKMAEQYPIEKLWNPNIQALRGLSILLVLIFHFLGWPKQFGAFGVGIFFCISGYLITNILITEFVDTGRISISDFYLRRARRLLPLALLVITLVWAIAGLATLFPSSLSQIARENSYGDLRHYSFSAIFSFFYVGNLLGFAQLGYNDLAEGLAHFWTLAVEEQFYFVWPVVLLTMLRRSKRLLSLVCVAGILATPTIHYVLSKSNITSWTLPTSYLDLFLFGALFAIHKDKIMHIRNSKPLVVGGFFLGSLTIVTGMQLEDLSSQGYVVYSLSEILIFLGLLNWKSFGEIETLRKLGNLSYSLYCIHWPIIILFINIDINSMLKKAITILLTFSLANLSMKYIESRFWKPRYLES